MYMLTGFSGPVLFGEDGERNLALAVFTLATANGTYRYEKLYSNATSSATPNVSRIIWPAGRTSAPSDSPPCGFEGELCVMPTGDKHLTCTGIAFGDAYFHGYHCRAPNQPAALNSVE